MTKCNFVSLTSGCGTQSCRWVDGCSGGCGGWGWGCSDGCGGSCGCNGGCLNGCNTSGYLNGCGSGCANSCASTCSCGSSACGCSSSTCGSSACGTLTGYSTDCSGCGCCGCGSCQTCACLWPDAPALSSSGVLVPRIIGTGRLCQRVNDVSLCVGDIPECAKAPYALVHVSASGPSDWEFISVERWRAVLRVNIPLVAQIRDCNGSFFTVHSSITVEVPVSITIPTTDLGRAHVAVIPGVKLVCVKSCSEDGCFTVALAVLVDVYVARWEPSANGETNPCRSDLPLTLPVNNCGCW